MRSARNHKFKYIRNIKKYLMKEPNFVDKITHTKKIILLLCKFITFYLQGGRRKIQF